MRFDPPPHVVKLLLTVDPDSPARVDCLRRTPLHVACGTRASHQVIQFLARAHPGACDVQDRDGKTPLHLACDSSCELFVGDGGMAREPPSYEVVQTLRKASPQSVPLEDNDEMSALEHAILSGADIKVIKLLQYATRKTCEAQSEQRDLSSQLADSCLLSKKRLRPSYERNNSGPTVDSSMSVDSLDSKGDRIPTTVIIPAMHAEVSPRICRSLANKPARPAAA